MKHEIYDTSCKVSNVAIEYIVQLCNKVVLPYKKYASNGAKLTHLYTKSDNRGYDNYNACLKMFKVCRKSIISYSNICIS